MSKFTVQFWGVRGSLPAPKSPQMVRELLRETLIDFSASKFFAADPSQGAGAAERVDSYLGSLPPWKYGGFGGDTSCVEVTGGETRLIVDAGSGLRRLGEKLMQDAKSDCAQGRAELHLFFTHFHWDHIVGLPFFAPIYKAGNRIHIYAVQPDLERSVRQVFQKPFFPVRFEDLKSEIHFHRLAPRVKRSIRPFSITPYELDHPDPCWGYRIEAETTVGRRSYAHCVDNEATRISSSDLGDDALLYRDADLCFFDAQYTLQEFLEHMNWGHSAAPIGLEIALREGVKNIYFAHHDPAASDSKIADAERQTREFLNVSRMKAEKSGRKLREIEWHFAREGDYLELGTLKV